MCILMGFNIKKTRKQKKVLVNKSVEAIHDEKMEYFLSLQEKLPGLIKRAKTPEQLREIEDIKSRKLEYKYLLDTSIVLNNFHMEQDNTKKMEYAREYYRLIGMEYANHRGEVMDTCDCGGPVELNDESFFTCVECGLVCDKNIDGYSFKDIEQMNIVNPFIYKRINYFCDWLMQIQSNENVVIPQEIMTTVALELRKRKIYSTDDLSYGKMKTILKETDNSRYYEHIYLIISLVSKQKPICLSEETNTKLKEMFVMIQQPFEVYKPANRKNFFSYPYIIYKFLELLNMKEELGNFSLLKSRTKLMKQDEIWKVIVNHLAKTHDSTFWRYIPST